MAAGQAGKVPGAPPRNPTDARAPVKRKAGKKSRKKSLKLQHRQSVETEGETRP